MTVETLEQSLAMSSPVGLLAGSALVALGASCLLAAVLLWWRRRTHRAPDPEPTTTVHAVDRYDHEVVAPDPPAEPTGPDLAEIDRRLEEVEQHLLHLSSRVDAVLRQRAHAAPRKIGRTSSKPEPAPVRARADAATPEEISLRALVGRSA